LWHLRASNQRMPKERPRNERKGKGKMEALDLMGHQRAKARASDMIQKVEKGMVTRTRVATRGKAEILGKEAAKASVRAALTALVITKKRPPRLLGL